MQPIVVWIKDFTSTLSGVNQSWMREEEELAATNVHRNIIWNLLIMRLFIIKDNLDFSCSHCQQGMQQLHPPLLIIWDWEQLVLLDCSSLGDSRCDLHPCGQHNAPQVRASKGPHI